MKTRLWLAPLATLAAALLISEPAQACPHCRVAAAGLASENSGGPASYDGGGTGDGDAGCGCCDCCDCGCDNCGPTFILTGGIDVASAYYRRGYLQDDSGLVVQPFLTAGWSYDTGGPFLIQPYVTSWNSFGLLDLDNPMAVMVEGMGGVFFKGERLSLDVNYAFYNTAPADEDSALQELGLKVAYDVSGLWTPAGEAAGFSLRPSVAFDWETYDEHGSEDSYWEFGIEPSWRTTLGGRRFGLSLPTTLGLSLEDYYFDGAGEEESLGYVTTGLAASTTLSACDCRTWFLSGSLLYTRLVADNLIAINDDEPDVLVGKIGIGFAM